MCFFAVFMMASTLFFGRKGACSGTFSALGGVFVSLFSAFGSSFFGTGFSEVFFGDAGDSGDAGVSGGFGDFVSGTGVCDICGGAFLGAGNIAGCGWIVEAF